MSHTSNDELLELARYHIDYWAGEGVGAAMEADIKRNDLEQLERDIRQSSKIMFDMEYRPGTGYLEEEQTDVY